jgi:hypothetical protein
VVLEMQPGSPPQNADAAAAPAKPATMAEVDRAAKPLARVPRKPAPVRKKDIAAVKAALVAGASSQPAPSPAAVKPVALPKPQALPKPVALPEKKAIVAASPEPARSAGPSAARPPLAVVVRHLTTAFDVPSAPAAVTGPGTGRKPVPAATRPGGDPSALAPQGAPQ